MEKEKKKYNYYTKTITCPDGKRKYIRGKTKKELAEKVKKAMADLSNGIHINDNTTFGELAQLWADVEKRPRVKPQTMSTVLGRVNRHLMPKLAQLRVRDIRPAHVLDAMNSATHLARSTQNLILSDMRSIFRFAQDNYLIAVSPVPSKIKTSGRGRDERVPLTPEECAALLEKVSDRPWLYTFVMLCLYAGLRAGEACGLCWDCVDLTENKILVRRQHTRGSGNGVLTETLKTQTSRRDVPAPPELMAHLRDVRRTATGITVLHDGVKSIGMSRVSRALERLDFDVHVFPHLLRHTYATRLVETGLDIKEVQALLGHSTPRMVLEVYSHYDKRSREAITAERVAKVQFVTEKCCKNVANS